MHLRILSVFISAKDFLLQLSGNSEDGGGGPLILSELSGGGDRKLVSRRLRKGEHGISIEGEVLSGEVGMFGHMGVSGEVGVSGEAGVSEQIGVSGVNVETAECEEGFSTQLPGPEISILKLGYLRNNCMGHSLKENLKRRDEDFISFSRNISVLHFLPFYFYVFRKKKMRNFATLSGG
jgi:hypothetical protein